MLILKQIKKAERTKGFSFGSSAVLILKTRRFPPPPYEGFGFIGVHQYTGNEN
jgi:hypothetical protein